MNCASAVPEICRQANREADEMRASDAKLNATLPVEWPLSESCAADPGVH